MIFFQNLQRPTTEEMVSWLDMETLILLFSMMVMVSIVCETGFFNYCAFIMYKVSYFRKFSYLFIF